jgi:AraC-like DNA-binding protein
MCAEQKNGGLVIERVSTSDLPATGRTAAWNDLYSGHMSRVEFTPADRHSFCAELRIGRLGPVELAKLYVDRCSIERTGRHLGESPRLYSFILQASGRSVFSHYGREALLSRGDFVLCDNGMPHQFTTVTPSEMIMVRVTPELLAEYLPSPERFCGQHLGCAVGIAHTAAAMVQSLSEQASFGRRDYEARIGRHLLDMISITYTMGLDSQPSSAATHRRHRDIIRYIEDHLHDRTLTAESVASGVHLSPRRVRTIFLGSGEKLLAFVLRRRVEECARRMRDPAWSGETLMKIAFSCGFNSAAHFTRAFRDHFGVSAREYRRGLPGGEAGGEQ